VTRRIAATESPLLFHHSRLYEGLKNRPNTPYGTVNADVLEHYIPDYRRGSMVERVMNSPWSE
jgi:hypothetical protein